jgi:hypothetical protein
MSRPGLLAALLLGCAGAPAPVRPVTAPPTPPRVPPPLIVHASSIGPVTAETPANLAALREALPGYTVRPVNDGMFDELHFAVSRSGELLFYVIAAEDGAIFNVHIMSPAVVIANKAWRPGGPFSFSDHLSYCDCWGGKPVCYRRGEHVAVAFDRACDSSALGTVAGRRVLQGEAIHRTVWNPKPFMEGPDPDDAAGGDPCGAAGGDPCAGP